MAVENEKQPVLSFAMLCVIAREQIPPSRYRAVWAERVKRRLVQLRLPYPERPEQLSAAMDAVERAVDKQQPVPAPGVVPHDVPGLTRDEATAALAALHARGMPVAMRTMPNVRPRTLREMEIHKAAAIVAQAIVDQVQRCDEVERALEAALDQETKS